MGYPEFGIGRVKKLRDFFDTAIFYIPTTDGVNFENSKIKVPFCRLGGFTVKPTDKKQQ